MAWGPSAPASAASATDRIEVGEDRSKPSGPGVRSGIAIGTPRAANRAERTVALCEEGPEAKPWR
jgi:hypothetical protein